MAESDFQAEPPRERRPRPPAEPGDEQVQKGPTPERPHVRVERIRAAEDYAGLYVLLASRENSRTVTGSILRGDGGIGVRGLTQPRGGDDL